MPAAATLLPAPVEIAPPPLLVPLPAALPGSSEHLMALRVGMHLVRCAEQTRIEMPRDQPGAARGSGSPEPRGPRSTNVVVPIRDSAEAAGSEPLSSRGVMLAGTRSCAATPRTGRGSCWMGSARESTVGAVVHGGWAVFGPRVGGVLRGVGARLTFVAAIAQPGIWQKPPMHAAAGSQQSAAVSQRSSSFEQRSRGSRAADIRRAGTSRRRARLHGRGRASIRDRNAPSGV